MWNLCFSQCQRLTRAVTYAVVPRPPCIFIHSKILLPLSCSLSSPLYTFIFCLAHHHIISILLCRFFCHCKVSLSLRITCLISTGEREGKKERGRGAGPLLGYNLCFCICLHERQSPTLHQSTLLPLTLDMKKDSVFPIGFFLLLLLMPLPVA